MAESIKLKKRSALTCWLMILGWLAMVIFALHACTHMVAAGDTWVALACGRHFINQGISVDKVTVEPFSANSHHAGPTPQDIAAWPKWAQWITDKVGIKAVKYWHPTGWINQNWLTHVIFYWLTHLSPFADDANLSFNSLAYWKFAIYIIAVICVYYTGKILRVNPALSAVFACFAMFIGRSYLDIRPAGFSNMLAAVYILILALATYRNVLYIWLIVPLAVFWCNVHGGYLYLFIMLVPFTAFNFLTIISKKRFVSVGTRGICHTVAAGIVAFLAMIIFNPFHLTNLTHTFIISVSKHAEMWRTVHEWHPAFEWTNPVGTSYPFLVLFVLGIGTPVLWLFSRLLKPRLLRGPKSEMEAQRKLISTLLKILGCIAAVFIFWVTFISFAFIDIDLASFFICITFAIILLLSVYKNVLFIYLTVALTVFALWLAEHFNPNANYEGRYIYPFAILPAYAILHIIASLLSDKVKIKARNIIFVIVAAIAAWGLMVMFFNPFATSGDSWSMTLVLKLKKVWLPTYTHNADPDYKHLAAWLYIVNMISVLLWLAIPYFLEAFKKADKTIDNQPQNEDTYQLPKIDLAMVAIAAISIYMAICSRRFIPIAGIAACPVIAMFIDQLIRIVSATFSFLKEKCFHISPMPLFMQQFFVFVAAVAVVTFGVTWGLKFKRIYLDPWPSDPKLNSVFMRMTASDSKPFYACQFIKINKLQGKIFNYWTEGGFIAWGQVPDPNTGFIPLKLFIDGRAQAAYEPDMYNLWMNIMGGGPIVRNAMQRNKKLTPDDYIKLGKWINDQMKKYNVWVILMPSLQFEAPFMIALEYNPDWQMVFLDDEQKIFVDTTTPRGEMLFEGISNGRILYPNEFSKNLIVAHYLLLTQTNEEPIKQGLNFATKAFNFDYSPTALQEIMVAAKFPEIKNDVDKFCQDYLDKFINNKVLWSNQHGYRLKVVSAIMTAEHLRRAALQEGNPGLAQSCEAKKQECNSELRLLNTIRW